MVKCDFLCNFIIIVHIFSLFPLLSNLNVCEKEYNVYSLQSSGVSYFWIFRSHSIFCLVTCACLCAVLQFNNLISIKISPDLYHGIIEYSELEVTHYSRCVQLLTVCMTTQKTDHMRALSRCFLNGSSLGSCPWPCALVQHLITFSGKNLSLIPNLTLPLCSTMSSPQVFTSTVQNHFKIIIFLSCLQIATRTSTFAFFEGGSGAQFFY